MKIYLLDALDCFIGEADVDPYAALQRCVLTPQPKTIGTEVARWVGGAWIVLPEYPHPPQPTHEELQAEIVIATQQRLDAFAQTRNYDGILSLCTYATSALPKFQVEGQYGVTIRDATWAKLYEMLAEITSGTRPIPGGFADVEPELPILEWPV